MDGSETTAESKAVLPPILRAELESPAPARGPWYRSIAPAYLGLFVWAPFFDSLWAQDLTRFSLPWLFASAGFASLLCFGLLYYVPASWGFQTGRSLGIVAASTFGTVGSEWITGIGLAIASIVWYAVAIDYAVDMALLGLNACGLIAADSLRMWKLGELVVKSPVYLATALFWIYITGSAALWQLTGVIVGLMRVYAPVAFLLMTAVALWLLPSVGSYHPDTAAMMRRAALATRWRADFSALQVMTGFFATAGLLSVDWGASAQRGRDVVLGGLSGIVLAASMTATMSLIAVAGATGHVGDKWNLNPPTGTVSTHQIALIDRTSPVAIDWPRASSTRPLALSFRWAVYYGIGGVPAAVILVLFGLAALAPAVYAARVYGKKLSTHWPLLGRAGWTWSGGAIAFVLGAMSWVSRLDLIFFIMGVVFAPAIGAMAGDWLRQRGRWPGLRAGVNRAGMIAWAGGLVIPLALEIGRAESPALGAGPLDDFPWWHSAPIWGFVASLLYYLILAGLGKEQPLVALGSSQ